jgi:3-hydroxyisobutyrate dehydrogenase-like beta-hydroxyacid dehydrogenase
MAEKPVVGFVGVGLMGWGMAKNAVEKGWPLRVIAHRKREAVDDLVKRGAREVANLDEMAAEAEIIVLCVTGAPEVQAIVDDIVPVARPGLTIVDTSTSEPHVSARLAEDLAGRGITFVDAPLSRTPQHTWDGEATTFVGGPTEVFDRIRPLLETWASAVIPIGGPVGSAHAVKLVNNLVALGYAAVWSECYATLGKLGIAPSVLREVVTNSGMNCGNFQSFSKYAVDGDPNAHKFTIANACKDLGYYTRMADGVGAATLLSDGTLQTLKLGMAMGMAGNYVPEMVDIVRRLNGPADQDGAKTRT